MLRIALYARYSSENQRDASIEDQLRQCRERAEREGWTVVETYSDRAIPGRPWFRAGIRSLLADAQAGRFDMVLSEALDRISRDQEDVAAVFKRLRFAGVSIVTLSEGEINELHVGLKGTMNALFIKRPRHQDPSRPARARGGRKGWQRPSRLRLSRCPSARRQRRADPGRTGDCRGRSRDRAPHLPRIRQRQKPQGDRIPVE
jgi:Site-specific recombinases, DNA invertase Pin homologs